MRHVRLVELVKTERLLQDPPEMIFFALVSAARGSSGRQRPPVEVPGDPIEVAAHKREDGPGRCQSMRHPLPEVGPQFWEARTLC